MDSEEDNLLPESDYSDYDYDDDAPANYSDYDDDDLTEESGGGVEGREICNDTVNFVIHFSDEVRERQENAIETVSSVLAVPKETASLLLRHFNWSVSAVEKKWYADEDRVRSAVGLFLKPVIETPEGSVFVCRICFEEFDVNSMAAAACGHKFCKFCLKRYISFAINTGPDCLTLRCPNPLCTAAINEEMMMNLVSEEDRIKYKNYLVRSYLENSKEMKWCPNPGCDIAIELGIGGKNYDVTCICSYRFCWNCLEEIHHPADCDTARKWKLKNNEESKNVSWILGNTKPCPKCKSPIEKDKGGMCVTCNCNHRFCWLCLDPWKEHWENSKGFYTCNKYDAAKKEGKIIEAEKARLMAKRCFERYTHYFERWSANELSKMKSISHLEKLKTESMLEKLSITQRVSPVQLDFIVEAWFQIIECRRILKWSYAYGYYIPEEDTVKKQFFEFIQGEAEAGLERLHQCAEEELEKYVNALWPLRGFWEFREKLSRLRMVTRNYFENLVKELENGLVEVAEGGLKGESEEDNVGNMEEEHWQCRICTLFNSSEKTNCEACGRAAVPFIPRAAKAVRIEDYFAKWTNEYWECPKCTMSNRSDKRNCEACGCWR